MGSGDLQHLHAACSCAGGADGHGVTGPQPRSCGVLQEEAGQLSGAGRELSSFPGKLLSAQTSPG